MFAARIAAFSLCLAASLSAYAADTTQTIQLGSLDLSLMRQGSLKPQVDRSVRQTSITLKGRTFEHGVGTHAVSTFWVDLGGNTESFKSFVGVDDAAQGPGSVAFRVYGDGRKLYDSGVMRSGAAPKEIDLPLTGVKSLLLRVDSADNGIHYDHADWADAQFVFSGTPPKAVEAPREEAVILTPKPAPSPRINGPKIYGCHPGNPFLYRIPATGDRPMTFAADQLPAGLKLDPATGIITGTAPAKGSYAVTLHASNSRGKTARAFKIVSGDTLALTPYMGWNDWYMHYTNITDEKMRAAADAMVKNGMADFGYSYVSIDDCWMNSEKAADPKRIGPTRNEEGNIVPNVYFPDMKGMTDYIHAKGLKAGIYTSPGRTTCCGFGASYLHEAADAKQFADWGFDLVKYDWCSYGQLVPKPPTLEQMQKPYFQMGKLLKDQKRDIIYNLCQYGMGNVWEWGRKADAQSWRTAGDLGVELDRIFQITVENSKHAAWNGPGGWSDPDYVQIGPIGGPNQKTVSFFSPNEQAAFMSMWSLMACPLMLSADIGKLDEYTLSVLCNAEVLEVNQDSLGQCAAVYPVTEDTFLMIKTLEDGSKAVGLCNQGEMEAKIALPWTLLGTQAPMTVRDLWRQKDEGVFKDSYEVTVPRHAVHMIKVTPAEQKRGPKA